MVAVGWPCSSSPATILRRVALPLLASALPAGFVFVHVLVDGVSSQRPMDRAAALRRLEAEGLRLSTSEMALFDLLKTAEAENFKAVSAIVREKRPEPPLPSL